MTTNEPIIAVNGASGFTGRLVVAELAQRGIDTVLVGRDPKRLRRAGGPGATVRQADIHDPATLVGAFRGCAVVINCAGPFTLLGEPAVRAAIAVGCHYVDITGEQHYLKRIFDTCARPAETAGVTVLPATTEDGVPGDLVSHLAAGRVEPVGELAVTLWYRDGGASRGTLRSLLAIADDVPLRYANGTWTTDPADDHTTLTPPARREPLALAAFPVPPVITVPRHVTARRIVGRVNADLADRLGTVSPELIDNLPEGPTDDLRRAHKWTIVADATGADGRTARGVVDGTDSYGSTAVIAVEAAHRLATGTTKPGVLAPAQAFDPADFLDSLTPHGVRWWIE